MSPLGESRRFGDVRATSALSLIADVRREDRQVRKEPKKQTSATSHKPATQEWHPYPASDINGNQSQLNAQMEALSEPGAGSEVTPSEEALRRAENFYDVANNLPMLSWIADADGSIFWYNRRWYEYTGASPESLARLGLDLGPRCGSAARCTEAMETFHHHGRAIRDDFPFEGKRWDFSSFSNTGGSAARPGGHNRSLVRH